LTPGGSSTHLHTNNTQKNKNKQHIEQHIIDTKQHIEQHIIDTKQYIEQHIIDTKQNIIDTKQYIEKHNSLIRKSAGRAPSLQVIPWHLPYN
jgi:FAD synthase